MVHPFMVSTGIPLNLLSGGLGNWWRIENAYGWSYPILVDVGARIMFHPFSMVKIWIHPIGYILKHPFTSSSKCVSNILFTHVWRIWTILTFDSYFSMGLKLPPSHYTLWYVVFDKHDHSSPKKETCDLDTRSIMIRYQPGILWIPPQTMDWLFLFRLLIRLFWWKLEKGTLPLWSESYCHMKCDAFAAFDANTKSSGSDANASSRAWEALVAPMAGE